MHIYTHKLTSVASFSLIHSQTHSRTHIHFTPFKFCYSSRALFLLTTLIPSYIHTCKLVLPLFVSMFTFCFLSLLYISLSISHSLFFLAFLFIFCLFLSRLTHYNYINIHTCIYKHNEMLHFKYIHSLIFLIYDYALNFSIIVSHFPVTSLSQFSE